MMQRRWIFRRQRLHAARAWLAAVWMLFGLAACAPSVSPPGPRFAAKLEPYEEAVDQGCSYFHFLWGKSAELSGRLEEAQFAYEQALVCDRKADYVMRSLAMLSIKMNKRQRAITWINRILAIKPHDTGARTLLANLYASLGQTDKALATYQAILAEEPDNQEVLVMLGTLYANNREYTKARKVLERLIRLNPDSYAGHYYLARLYRELGFVDRAQAAYRKALDLNWSSVLAYEAAEYDEQEQRYQAAAGIYQRILAENPADERARGLLANAYLQMGKTTQALEQLRRLRRYASDPLRVEVAIGRVLLDGKRYQEAVTHFQHLLARHPEAEQVRPLLVYSLVRAGRSDEARALLAKTPPRAKGYEEAVLMLAKLLEEGGRVGAAEALLRAQLSDPERRRLSFYVSLAHLYRQQGKPAKGEEVFVQGRRDYPGDARMLFEYGLFVDRRGDRKRAMAIMEQVLALDPHNPYALNYVGYSWAEQGKNLEQARKYIEEAVRRKPDDGFIRDSLGWVFYQLGQYDQAVKELERAVKLAPDDPTIYEHLGDAYRKQGAVAQARRAYRKSLSLYKESDKRAAVRRKIEALPAKP